MKKDDLKFKKDSWQVRDTFIKTCLFEPSIYDEDRRTEYFNFLNKTLDDAKTTDDFTDAFLANKKFKGMQGYQELMKSERPDQLWYFVRENFGDRCIKTMSDAGGVKVGTDDFSVIFQNGYGDGTTRIAVFDSREELYAEDVMKFDTSISGQFSIYDYDCGGEPIVNLDGRYGVYHFEGLVAFVKWH